MMRPGLITGVNVDPVDLTAGLELAAALGYNSAEHQMVTQYALMRHARGEEDGAQQSALSGGIDLTSWCAILAAAITAAQRQGSGPGRQDAPGGGVMATFIRLTDDEARGLTRRELIDRVEAEQRYWHTANRDRKDRAGYQEFTRIMHAHLDVAAQLRAAADHIEFGTDGGYMDTPICDLRTCPSCGRAVRPAEQHGDFRRCPVCQAFVRFPAPEPLS